MRNSFVARSRRAFGARRHDLRELEELGHRLALGDALGAERDVDVEAEPLDQALHHRGDARVHGAAQHEELAVGEARGDVLDRRLDRVEVGVEVLVDRRADDDHDRVGVADRGRARGGADPALGEDLLEHLARARAPRRAARRR